MVRPMQPSDRAAFVDMAKAFYASDAVLHAVPDWHFDKTFDEVMAQSPYVRGYIICRDEQIAGYALLALTYSNEAGGLVVWFEELFVLPAFQGQGLGREAFAYVEATFEGKAARLRLEVEPDNVRAQALYRQLGYEGLPYSQMVKPLE